MDVFKKYYIIIYGIGLILIPPIHCHGKSFFAAEWMLLPLVALCLYKILIKEMPKPDILLLSAWGATTVAFVAGYFRGDLASQITQYPLAEGNFSLGGDGISYIRWLVILATPWMAKQLFAEEKYVKLFFSTLKYCFLISSLLVFTDHFHLISLEDWGFYKTTTMNWLGRSYGTFASPNEAGLMYGLFASYLLTSEKNLKDPLSLVTLLAVIGALVLSHCGTAMAALAIAYFSYVALSEGRGWKVYTILGLLIFAGYIFTTHHGNHFFTQKINDLFVRQITWRNWMQVAPSHLAITFFGIGFSKLVVDNGIILLLVQGGILFLVAVLRWVKENMLAMNQQMKFLFFFWGLTWLTLDSISYWGVGRLCWFLFGLLFVGKPQPQDQK